MDETDKKILRRLQVDASQPLERLAQTIGLSKTSVWNRIQKMRDEGLITAQVMLVDPDRAGVPETFFIAVRTDQHNADWLSRFSKAIEEMPEITEAHRMAGDVDYLLKVQVPDTRTFDAFYKRLVARVNLYSVTSMLSMERIKASPALPL